MSGIAAKLGIAGLVAGLVASGSEAAAQRPAAGAVGLRERSANVTEGSVIVNAPPAEVYGLITDYARWPQAFSDIRSVTVEGGGRDRALVRFQSRTFRYTVTVQFNNIPGRAIRFRGVQGPPGGRAGGEYLLTPIDGGRRTRLTARLYMDVVGATSLFVSEERIRGYRRAKLRADLGDAARYFANRPRGDAGVG